MHVPAAQALPLGQTFPQEPQLFRSVLESTHELPHASRPPVQAQAPEVQTWPMGQTWPQEPQLLGSVLVETQLPPQDVVPPLQPPPPPPPPPPPQVPLHWQWNVALTLPLEPLRVNGSVLENWPLIGSGLHVWQSTSVPEKPPFASTVPVKAPDASEQCPPEQVKVPEPELVPAGVTVVPVQA
jgi:hypothetical protein